MTIFEAYMCDRFEDRERRPEWFRAERYDYCESEYMTKNGKKNRIVYLFTTILSAIF